MAGLNVYKWNKVISAVIISLFVISLLPLVLADYHINNGIDKWQIIVYFLISPGWLTIPSILSLIVNRKLAEKWIVLRIIFILNLACFFIVIRIVLAYLHILEFS